MKDSKHVDSSYYVALETSAFSVSTVTVNWCPTGKLSISPPPWKLCCEISSLATPHWRPTLPLSNIFTTLNVHSFYGYSSTKKFPVNLSTFSLCFPPIFVSLPQLYHFRISTPSILLFTI